MYIYMNMYLGSFATDVRLADFVCTSPAILELITGDADFLVALITCLHGDGRCRR